MHQDLVGQVSYFRKGLEIAQRQHPRLRFRIQGMPIVIYIYTPKKLLYLIFCILTFLEGLSLRLL